MLTLALEVPTLVLKVPMLGAEAPPLVLERPTQRRRRFFIHPGFPGQVVTVPLVRCSRPEALL
jgi:hypothetical protein